MNNFIELRKAQTLKQKQKIRITEYCNKSGDKFSKVWRVLRANINMPSNSHPLDKEKEFSLVVDRFLK